MEKPNLKPCPFCGSKPFLNGRGPSVNGHMAWQVGCDSEECPVHDVWGAGYSGDDEAIKAWNTRHKENPRHHVMVVGDDHDRIPLIEAINQIGFDGIIIAEGPPLDPIEIKPLEIEYELPERYAHTKMPKKSNAERCGYSTKRK